MTSPPPPALAGNLALLEQGLRLLDQLTQDSYRATWDGQSSIGAQYRHILEHYGCLLAGADAGRVDYDTPPREKVLEEDLGAAAQRTRELTARLTAVDPTSLHRPLLARHAATADQTDLSGFQSSLGRELLFLLSHTVHHFAVIRLLLQRQGTDGDPRLGVAPSTEAHKAAAR